MGRVSGGSRPRPGRGCVVLVAGRSGGHIIPGMTLAARYCAENNPSDLVVFSTGHALDKKVLAVYAGVVNEVVDLRIDGVPSRLYGYPFFCWRLFCGFLVSLRRLASLRPACVILMGGYVSIPVCLAAWLLRIECDLYELNAVPGKATRVLSRCSTNVYVCFSACRDMFFGSRARVCEYPLRFQRPCLSRAQAHAFFALDPAKVTILILGGSQGSVTLNDVVHNVLVRHPMHCDAVNVIHQTGSYDTTDWAGAYASMGVSASVFSYSHDLSRSYEAADIIVSRAGAGTLFEVIFFKKPCILIPLEIAGNDHQLSNARAIACMHPNLFTVVRHGNIHDADDLLGAAIVQAQEALGVPRSAP